VDQGRPPWAIGAWLSHVLAEVSCISLFLSLSALAAEPALVGAAIAEAPRFRLGLRTLRGPR